MIEIMMTYAMTFVGVHYRWGGNSPLDGMDCSGYAQEVLASVGKDPKGDQTAQGLFNHFHIKEGKPVQMSPQRGALVFFGRNYNRITHVGIALNDLLMIESGGGDSTTDSKTEAAKRNAMVRIRPISNRKDFLGAVSVF